MNVVMRWLLTVGALGMFLTGCQTNNDNTPQPQTIGQRLATTSNLTLLRAALTRAGLDAQLSQSGSITLFAPSDSAFIRAGYANVAAINSAPADTLKRLLQYHLLSATLQSSSLAVGTNIPQQTVAGLPVYITKTTTTTVTSTTSTSATTSTAVVTGATSVNGARLLQADVEATNGIVHVIDKVLLPPTGNIIQTLTRLSKQGPNSFTLLVTALARTRQDTTLQKAGPYTLFAPPDAGFQPTGYTDLAGINAAPLNRLAAITGILTASGRYFSTNFLPSTPLPTISGQSIYALLNTTNRLRSIAVTGVAGSENLVTATDIIATNGVIHVVTSAYNVPR